jgi:hypothetical protein
MTIRGWRPAFPFTASFAVAVLLLAPCNYARPQEEPPPQAAEQPADQQSAEQQFAPQQPTAQQSQPEQAQAQQPQAQNPPAAAPNAAPPSGQSTNSQTNSGQKPNNSNDPPPTTMQSDAGSKDRLFFTLPNFLTLENSAHVPPMTVGQKFKVAARSSFDYVQYPWYAALAGISQAQNSEPGYGQGAEGYAKRYGAAFADGTIENFMVNAVVPSLMRTDPRYYQLGKGGKLHRTEYALSRLFITRTDSGHNTFNFAEVGGSLAAAAISTYSYHPEADKNFGNTASVWGTQVGYDAIRIVLNEFWPDIRRKFSRHHSEPQP